jgi:DNA-3-methyladenine glycosylase
VCSPEGTASGVLLRAAEVIDGSDVARERRTTSKSDADLAQGPARLTVAAGILLADDGTDLLDRDGAIRIELPDTRATFAAGPRTGVSGPGGGLEFPWRFWIAGDPTVSTYRAHVSKRRTA